MWTVLSSYTDDLWICSPPGREKRKWVRVKHLTLSAPLWSPSNIISSSGGSTTSSNGPASRREPLAGSPPAPSHIWLSGNSAAAAPSGTAACSYPKKKRKRIFIYLKGERNVWGAKIHKEAEQTRDGRGSQTERVGGCEDHRGPCGERTFLKAGREPVILATRDNVTHSRPPPPPLHSALLGEDKPIRASPPF